MLKNVIWDYIKKIKGLYQEEFEEEYAKRIKWRVHLFCGLTLGLYVMADIIAYFFLKEPIFEADEIFWFSLLLSGAALISFLAGRCRTIRASKVYAYAASVLTLFVISAMMKTYVASIPASSEMFLFMLFFISFAMFWTPPEALLVGCIVIFFYSDLFVYTQNFLSPEVGAEFNVRVFSEGISALVIGTVLCGFIRRDDVKRDLENFILFRDLEAKNDRIEKDLEFATVVHKTLIPGPLSNNMVDIGVMYKPMVYIGGDYARFHFVDPNRMIFIIADVTGHGVPAALMVNRLHSEFYRLSREDIEPARLLDELNRFIKVDFSEANMYLTAFCGKIDFARGSMSYSNYGHPDQYLWLAREKRVEGLAPDNPMMGISVPGAKGSAQESVSISSGDKLLLFTDGVTEAHNALGEEFGKQRLTEFIRNNPHLPAGEFNRELIREIDEYTSGKIDDDIFVIRIDIKKTG